VTPATARSRTRAHGRTRVAPRPPRRVSGPVRRPVAAPAGAPPLSRTTSVFARVRALPEHRVVDRLLRSRAWIWALGVLLGGIVTMQVSLLKLNSGISRAVETATTLERQNANLEAAIARKSSPDRIESGATTLGMLMPPAGDVGYLTAGPKDAERAVRRMEPPSDAAAALLANHGIVPGSLAASPLGTTVAAPTVPAATTPGTTTAASTTTPSTTAASITASATTATASATTATAPSTTATAPSTTAASTTTPATTAPATTAPGTTTPAATPAAPPAATNEPTAAPATAPAAVQPAPAAGQG
jgi:hypothetical protein